MAQGRDRRRALVSSVMNLRVTQNSGNFSTSWGTLSFSTRLWFLQTVIPAMRIIYWLFFVIRLHCVTKAEDHSVSPTDWGKPHKIFHHDSRYPDCHLHKTPPEYEAGAPTIRTQVSLIEPLARTLRQGNKSLTFNTEPSDYQKIQEHWEFAHKPLRKLSTSPFQRP